MHIAFACRWSAVCQTNTSKPDESVRQACVQCARALCQEGDGRALGGGDAARVVLLLRQEAVSAPRDGLRGRRAPAAAE